MNKKILMLGILITFQSSCISAEIESDREFSVIAAEQENFEESKVIERKPSFIDKLNMKTNDKIKHGEDLQENVNQESLTVGEENSSIQKESSTETIDISENTSVNKNDYQNFNEIVTKMNFIPLYIPKKCGYEMIELSSENKIAKIKFRRKWEIQTTLEIRTYKRENEEKLKDISGVTNVKWRVDNANGIAIYIARVSEKQQVAAWAVNQYTFSVFSENLSYIEFYSLLTDELVELSTHYYIES